MNRDHQSYAPCRRPGCPGVANRVLGPFCTTLCRGLDGLLHRVRRQLANEHVSADRLQVVLDREDALVTAARYVDEERARALVEQTRRYSRTALPQEDPAPSLETGVGAGQDCSELGYSEVEQSRTVGALHWR